MADQSPLRRLARTTLVVVGLIVSVIVVGIPIYVTPRTDDPGSTDLVFVLGTPTRAKVKIAENLVENGQASRILISVPQWGRWAAHNLTVCDAERDYEVDCLTPDPATTQGEAQLLRDFAERTGARSATVVTSVAHITRARLVFERCFRGDLNFVDDEVPRDLAYWAREYPYQTGALVKALINSEC